jgi:hypothetical protein
MNSSHVNTFRASPAVASSPAPSTVANDNVDPFGDDILGLEIHRLGNLPLGSQSGSLSNSAGTSGAGNWGFASGVSSSSGVGTNS